MSESDDALTWRDYEDHIYDRLSEWAGDQASVRFDQKIEGRHSKVERQVDVLIRGRFAGVTEREITAAVDCKYYTRNIDVKKVDEFIGFVDDVHTDLGLLITNHDFSPAARARAAGARGIELQVIVANVERLPPVFHPAWDDSYYESAYHDGGAHAPDWTTISYSYIDPNALGYSYDADNPPERFDDAVLSGPTTDISWGSDSDRARCVRAILKHRQGQEPSADDVKLVVRELAFHWEDGYPWCLYDAQLTNLGL
ncbi:MAG TPA: restriction endonuclease [Conexibacter sp.]|jgi:hypothetical protein